MRLFCGLSLAYEVRRNLELMLEHLRPEADLAWSPSDNFHITTKFLGEFDEARLEELKAALRSLASPGPIPIRVRGLGWFPNPHQPRVLFAGIDAPESLPALHRATDEAAARLGIAAETRPYSPHLTLARIKPAVKVDTLRRAIAQLPSADFGQFTAARHLLYRSVPSAGGSVYSVVGEFPL